MISKRAEYAVIGIVGLLVIAFLGSLIAIVAMGQFRDDLNPLKIPEYFWYYRQNSYVMMWLLKGMAIAAVLCGLATFLLFSRKTKLHGDARWATELEIRNAGLRAKKGILLGRKGRRALRFGGTEHVLLEAPTRAGKGVGVVVPNLLEWPDSVVVLDVKQENWDLTAGHRRSAGQTVLLFNPLDTTGKTVRFNPLAYIDRHNEIEVINELQKIAAMLFPSQTGESSFWMDAARTAFIGVGGYVAATAIKGEKGRPFTIGEIYRNLTVGNPQKRFPKLIAERAAAGVALSGPCVSALNDFTSSSDNTFTGIRQSVTARIGLWLNPYVDAATSESDFDFRDFRNKRISLYLGVSPDNLERVADLYNLMFQQLIDLNVRELPTKTKNNVQLLLLLDEFARLGRASVIANGFSYVAGYGIRLLPVIQSRSQLRAVYGKDVTDEIVANCGVELVFTPKEKVVAQEISERLGYYTFAAKSRSHKEFNAWGANISHSDQRRALMMPQELMLMGNEDIIVLRAGISAVRGTKIRFYQDRNMAKLTQSPPPVMQRHNVDLEAAAELVAAIEVAEREEPKALTDEETKSGSTPPNILLDPDMVEAIRDNFEEGVKKLHDFYGTVPETFVDR